MKHVTTMTIDGKSVEFETGRIARQADGAVVVKQGKTVVLVTAVAAAEPREGIDFFPLTVEYREQSAAVGRIPGGYLKREGRIADHEVLVCRLIDRTIRPRFPKGYRNEVQVIATVLGAEADADPAPLAMLGACAALEISAIPFDAVGGLTVVRTGGELRALPNAADRAAADIELVVSAGADGLVMVEGALAQVPEKDIVEALGFATERLGSFFAGLEEMRGAVGREKRPFESPADPPAADDVAAHASGKLRDVLAIADKRDRKDALDALKAETVDALGGSDDEERRDAVKTAFAALVYATVRRLAIEDGVRIGGRAADEIRAIDGEVAWLPTNHGSALFTRGETQAVVSCTLGSAEDQKREERLFGDESYRFLLHYNFPPYSVGETRPMRGPGRREIGHGALALRALQPVLPDFADFPYTLRIVSTITESNGSSSMATVCGGAMAMMDAGVPLAAPVAGIAMGLLSDGENVAILSDILGDEDHLGDMDFKVCGTEAGVTALQLDNKLGALPAGVLERALEQARVGRLHILERMKTVIPGPREELPPQAPRVETVWIRPERVRDLIGPRGAVIQDIQATTETRISVDDAGQVLIYATTGDGARRARARVEYVAGDPEVGRLYEGKVVKTLDFGAFVKILANTEGLVHVSELAAHRVENTNDVVNEGDTVVVRLTGVTDQGKLQLSIKDAANAGGEHVIRDPA